MEKDSALLGDVNSIVGNSAVFVCCSAAELIIVTDVTASWRLSRAGKQTYASVGIEILIFAEKFYVSG